MRSALMAQAPISVRALAMNTPASAPITIFALTPPQILLKTDPIIHPTAHVGLSIVNHYKDPLGVAVLFGPWLGQALYETVELYVNGNPNPVASEIVMNASAAVLLRLPSGLLLEDVNSLQCKVERPSGNGDTSPELLVLYFVHAPGGDDPVAGGGHPALAISVSPTSVDAAQAALGVTLVLDWPHKHLYDVVTVDCGGVLITHRIEPTPTDPNPDLTKPVVLTLTTQHFAKDPNNPQFPIKYNVISQTGNYSGTTQLGQFNGQDHWSVPCLIDTHLDCVELAMAILQEIFGENGDDPSQVDLNKLNGGPLWALIHLIETIWQAGDEIHLTFTAVDGNGTVLATYEVTLTIQQVPGQMSLDIPNAEVIADSVVRVKYEQIRGGKVIGVSRVAEAKVVGAVPVEEDFEKIPLQSVPVGESIDTPAMKITWVAGGNANAPLLSIVPPGHNHPVPINGKSLNSPFTFKKLDFDFKFEYSGVVFCYAAVQQLTNVVSFYDKNGGLLGRKSLQPNPPFEISKFEFFTPGIRKMEITSSDDDFIYFDEFKFSRGGRGVVE